MLSGVLKRTTTDNDRRFSQSLSCHGSSSRVLVDRYLPTASLNVNKPPLTIGSTFVHSSSAISSFDLTQHRIAVRYCPLFSIRSQWLVQTACDKCQVSLVSEFNKLSKLQCSAATNRSWASTSVNDASDNPQRMNSYVPYQ